MTTERLWPALLALLVTGCAASADPAEEPQATATETPQPTATTAPQPTSTTTAPPEVKVSLEDAVKKYVSESAAAWAAKDSKKQSALYASDGVVGMAGPNGWTESKPADMNAQYGGYFAAFPDLKLTYTRVIGKGNLAVAEWVFTGTNSGEMRGKKATNKKVGYRGASLLTFGPDGKVKRESVYFDTQTMMGQLGFGPKGQPVRAVEATPTAATEFVLAKDETASDATARKWLSIAETGDVKVMSELAADDIVVSNQYMPADEKGKKSLEKGMKDGAKAFVDQKLTILVCVPAGDVVACEYSWQATWKGPAMGMKPTGKTGSVHSLEILTLKAGKVAMTRAYANGDEFATTFGIEASGVGAPDARSRSFGEAKATK